MKVEKGNMNALDWGKTTEERNKNVNKYLALKAKHEKMINDFPMGFAFSTEQFEEAKAKLGVTSNDELIAIPSGGFIRKSDKEAYRHLWETYNKETTEAIQDDEYLYQGFLYELGNHEYGYTCDPRDTLAYFGLTPEDLVLDTRLHELFKKAEKKYWETFES